MSATYANLFCVVWAAAPICCRAATGCRLCTSHISPFLLAHPFDQICTTSSRTSNLNGKANCTFMDIPQLRRRRTMHINFDYVLFSFFSCSKRRPSDQLWTNMPSHIASIQSRYIQPDRSSEKLAGKAFFIDFISDSDVHPPLLLQFDISSRPLFLNRVSLVEILLFHTFHLRLGSSCSFDERRNYVHAKNVHIKMYRTRARNAKLCSN